MDRSELIKNPQKTIQCNYTINTNVIIQKKQKQKKQTKKQYNVIIQ